MTLGRYWGITLWLRLSNCAVLFGVAGGTLNKPTLDPAVSPLRLARQA